MIDIINCTLNVKSPLIVQVFLSKIESASFADECRYELRNFGRHFCCVFVSNGIDLKEYSWSRKDLSILAEDMSILENELKNMVEGDNCIQ